MSEIYPNSRFSESSPPPIIMGEETEYFFKTSCQGKIDRVILSNSFKQASIIREPKGFSDNGARIYVDGDNLEYAAAEALGPADAASADHAGIKVVNELWHITKSTTGLVSLPRPLRRSGGVNLEGQDKRRLVSLGTHENLLLPFSDKDTQINSLFERLMLTHVFSRPIWNGNGFVAQNYLLSQKAPGIGRLTSHSCKGVSPTVHGKKSALSILNNDSTSSEGTSRAEIRYADAHMQPIDTFMALSSLSLVARLVELGYITKENIDDYSFKQPIQLAYDTGKSLDVLNKTYETESGGRESMTSMQQKLAELSLSASQESDLPSDERLGAKLWANTVERIQKLTKKDIKTGDFSLIDGWTEWASKYCYIKDRTKHNLDFNNIVALAEDLRWTTTEEKPVTTRPYLSAAEQALIGKMVSNIALYATNAPLTRAKARSELLHRGNIQSANWNSAVDKSGHTYALSDPYQTELYQAPHK